MERVLGFLSRHFFRQVIFDDFFSANWVRKRKNHIILEYKKILSKQEECSKIANIENCNCRPKRL